MSTSLDSIEAIYEGGVLRPLNPTRFREGDRVRLLVDQSISFADSLRMPDPPLIEESQSAPCEIPRNSGTPVVTLQVTGRLPDRVGL